jgi:hypothetical protein
MLLEVGDHARRDEWALAENSPIVALQEWTRSCGGRQRRGRHHHHEGNVGARIACLAGMSSSDINPAAEASLAGIPAPVVRPEHMEGDLARLIEQQAGKIPSHWFLFSALASMGLALALELRGRQRESRFVGMWPGPLLALGIYNKLVKTMGTR